MTQHGPHAHRRDFLKATAATALAGSAAPILGAYAGGSDTIRVGIVGCGGRGSGAAENVLNAAPNVHIVAIGDAYESRVRRLQSGLSNFMSENKARMDEMGNKVDLPNDRCFHGLDAYQRVIDTDANYIILATPPGFRPLHLQAAAAAKKHIFTEKPVAVDGTGIRTCFKVYEETLAKGLAVVAGTQRRHQRSYLEVMKRIHDGEIGEIVSGQCYWNQSPIWFRKREPGMSDVAYQLHNWYHFLWVCGDHIVEQHVHNIDVINWATQSRPIRAVGMGGRVMPCTDPNVDGHIFNFFSIDFEYPKGVHVHSMCRQVANCANHIGEAVQGTKGQAVPSATTVNGKNVGGAAPRGQRRMSGDPYVQEHTDLIESIRAGKPLNELENVTNSTLAAIMGRMSAYTGKAVTWEQALNSKLDTMPKNLTWDMSLQTPPVPVPGQTELI